MTINLIQTEPANADAGGDVPSCTTPKGYPLKLCPNSTSVLIGRNGRGQWIARECHGLYGGLFVSRENAVRYALFENGHRPEAIIMVAGILELDMSVTSTPEGASAVAPLQSRAA